MGRVLVDAAFAPSFGAWPELALALAWAAVAVGAVTVALGRGLGLESGARPGRGKGP